MNDIGNLHVIDYYLYQASGPIAPEPRWLVYQLEQASRRASQMPKWLTRCEPDFDISTEQREGWAYDD